MMKKLVLATILAIFLSINLAFAQQDTTKKYGWFHSGVAGLNISQIAFNNWTQGGDNALSWTLTGNFGSKYINNTYTFDNTLKIAYGRTKLGGQDIRTNDNELYLVNIVSKNIGWDIEPFFSNTVRTSLTKGYDYSTTPAVEIADFFDPGYITQSIGFTYDKLEHFKTRLGLAFQEVFSNTNTKYTDDLTTGKVEKFKFETGLESVSSTEFTVAENLLATSSLRLFTRFESLDVWDVRWDNALVAKINDFLNVNLTFLLIYQEDQSKQAQMKQTLQLGFVYTLF